MNSYICIEHSNSPNQLITQSFNHLRLTTLLLTTYDYTTYDYTTYYD